jgi:hypothetical protein
MSARNLSARLLTLLPIAIMQATLLFAATPPATAADLLWSSYLGGSDLEHGGSLAIDSTGNAWVTGTTESTDFPTIGGFQTDLNGSPYHSDAYIAKIAPSGELVWATYLGGSGVENSRAIAVDSTGNVWVTGWTASRDFPMTDPSTSVHGSEVFVAKITPSGELACANTIRGNGADWAETIAIDSTGNAWVAGRTRSTDFPTPGGFDSTYSGDGDNWNAFIARFNEEATLEWASLLGGSANSEAFGIVCDTSGNAWVTGTTASSDFPTPGGSGMTPGGTYYLGDAFLAKITPWGTLAFATCFGGGDGEWGGSIAIDSTGNLWITGMTWSTDLPTPGGFQTSYSGPAYDPEVEDDGDSFVARFAPSGDLAWASYLGGSGPDEGYSIATDAAGNAWVMGHTTSNDFPTPGGAKPVGRAGCSVSKITPSGALAWTGYLGGTHDDWGDSVALDSTGNVWVTGQTNSPDFPMPGGFQTSLNGQFDSFVAEFSADVFALSPVSGDTLAVGDLPTFTFSVNQPFVPAYICFSSSPRFLTARTRRPDEQADTTLGFRLAENATQWQPMAAQWKAIRKIVCLGDRLYWRVEAKGTVDISVSATRSLQFAGNTITGLAVTPSHLADQTVAVWPDKTAPPTFSWSGGDAGMKYYYVDVSTDSAMPPKSVKKTASFAVARRLVGAYRMTAAGWARTRKLAAAGNGRLYWRVRCMDANRALKCSSDVQTLLVDGGTWTPPSVSQGAQGPVVSWGHDGEGIVRYRLEFTTAESSGIAPGPTVVTPAVSAAHTSYALKVSDIKRLRSLARRTGATTLHYRVRGEDAERAFVTYSDSREMAVP